MPVFEDDAQDIELQKKNIKVIESSGYKVIPVKDSAYKNNGGIHCLINIIE